jgi:hypothetical protein
VSRLYFELEELTYRRRLNMNTSWNRIIESPAVGTLCRKQREYNSI